MYKINGNPIDLSKVKEIAAGGEGRILEHPTKPNKVVKLYHTIRPSKFRLHLEQLKSLPSDSFVVPDEIVEDDKGKVAGFTMNYVNFNDYKLFNNLFNKGFCTTNNITYDYKIDLLQNLKDNVEHLHKNDIQIGDLNQYNLYFKKGKVLFVDVDSYQTKNNLHSMVFLEDIRDFTAKEVTNQSDAWAFDILTFWTLSHVHPFKWVVPGNTETLEYRIKSNKSIISNIPNIIIPKIFERPTGILLDQFNMIFDGRRFMIDFNNVVHQVSAIIKPVLQSQQLTIRELFTDVYEVNAAKDQIAIKVGKEWHLIRTASKGFTTIKTTVSDIDAIYPGETDYVIVKDDELVSNTGSWRFVFSMPKFYYTNGSLMVLDYDQDKQYNFDIDKQLGGSISYNITSVFAKSVIFNEAPIQNFGVIKRINVPFRNSYRLFELQSGTKMVHYDNDYIGSEYIKNNVVEYAIGRSAQLGKITLDYLPHFASNGVSLFVPEDGKIVVFNGVTPVATLDAPMCTRSSKLYFTNAGILILENNILYLANTK